MFGASAAVVPPSAWAPLLLLIALVVELKGS
jgi:hypothetical protein